MLLPCTGSECLSPADWSMQGKICQDTLWWLVIALEAGRPTKAVSNAVEGRKFLLRAGGTQTTICLTSIVSNKDAGLVSVLQGQ